MPGCSTTLPGIRAALTDFNALRFRPRGIMEGRDLAKAAGWHRAGRQLKVVPVTGGWVAADQLLVDLAADGRVSVTPRVGEHCPADMVGEPFELGWPLDGDALE